MDVHSFLMALDRFTARRGVPEAIWSDNGSNFLAADRELAAIWRKNKNRESAQVKFPQTTWHFNPPHAPWMNGAVERLIGATKKSLYHAMPPSRTPTDEQFGTALTVVEGILNSRPLTYVAATAEDPKPLSPADFLMAAAYRATAVLPPGQWSKTKQWHILQDTLDKFWKRFCMEIIPHLQSITKEARPAEDLRVGDVVAYVGGENRGRWPLGRITAVETSRDNRVRVVKVLTEGRELRRPAREVMLLLEAA